jgi:hypothetical protein
MKQIDITPIENMVSFYNKKVQTLENELNQTNSKNAINGLSKLCEVISSFLKVSSNPYERFKNFCLDGNIQNFRSYERITNMIQKTAYDAIIFSQDHISTEDTFLLYLNPILKTYNKSLNKNYDKEIKNSKSHLIPFYNNINKTIELTNRLNNANEYIINRPYLSKNQEQYLNKSLNEIIGLKAFEEALETPRIK